MANTDHVDSPLGGITLASDGESLTGLWFDGQRYFAGVPEAARPERNLPVFAQARAHHPDGVQHDGGHYQNAAGRKFIESFFKNLFAASANEDPGRTRRKRWSRSP